MRASDLSDTTLSLAIVVSAAAWGLYWYPLRTIEAVGVSGTWSVVFFNACPLLVLCPLLLFQWRKLAGILGPTLLAGLMIGMAFTLYANSLVETTVVRGTLLFYLTPIWSTLLGVLWLSEKLTRARVIAIVMGFAGLLLLLSNGDSSSHPLNIGDLYGFLSGIFWAIGAATLNRWSKIPILPLAAFIFMCSAAISTLFASFIDVAPLPDLAMLKAAFPSAAFWSIVVMAPSFCIVVRVSQILFPGRVGILMMSEVIVAIVSASILIPEETMLLLQWLGALVIVAAGLVEVLFGYHKPEQPLQPAASPLDQGA